MSAVMLEKLTLAAAGTALMSGIVFTGSAEAAGLVNGDFETGDLTGWTTFTTTNGTVGTGFPKVRSFDTDNDGVASNSAAFRVGQVDFEESGGTPRGGGIFQEVSLGDGDLNISVDIATLDTIGGNYGGGIFELLFDGIVVDNFDFGFVAANVPEFSELSYIDNIIAGTYQVGIRITRPYTQNSYTPVQYVDHFQLSGSAVNAVDVPEPTSTLVFFGISTFATGVFRKRRQKS
ncbi:PEP-CTERM sorting domain-containing protein [Lusitaniella coriacea]|uniref:PEP-CTERM sorting domain-containing protein n=1 Tax=Lusitaniella coriacea TaxID=1983105 RepID=UPI003CEA79FD